MRRPFLSLLPLIPLIIVAAAYVRAQETSRTVDAGVYTDAQADRGALVYDASCAGCHRADLGGGTAPALKEQRFAREFAGKDLKTLYTRIATTMPRDEPGTLGDTAYLDVLAHVLRENGFPAGRMELTGDALDGIQIVPGRPKTLPPIGDFSYVDVVGCLTRGPGGTWLLTRASDPVAAAASSSAAHQVDAPTALGSQSFHLVDAV